jgi:hypothetical protein
MIERSNRQPELSQVMTLMARGRIGARALVRPRARSALAALLVAIALVTGEGFIAISGAAFSGTTGNPANSTTADALAAPTAFTSVPSCTAPSVVATSSADDAGGAVTLVVPGAAVSGDLLIAHLANDGTSTPPAGWSLLNGVNAASNLQARLYQRIATAGDPGTAYAFSVSSGKAAGTMLVLRGAAGLVSSGQTAGLDNGSTKTIVAPSVSTTVDKSLLISFFSLKTDKATFSVPAGMTEAYDVSGKDISRAADWEVRASPGATGTRSSTATKSAVAIGQSIVVAPGNPVIDLAWTPTASTWATGYEVERNAVVVATVTPGTASTWTDASPGSGSTTYSLTSAFGTWRSAPATATLDVACV